METFKKHEAICDMVNNGYIMYQLPEKRDLIFNDLHKSISPAFVAYADFESLLEVDDVHLQVHKPIAVGCYFTRGVENVGYTSQYIYYAGEECIKKFILELIEFSELIN